MLLLKYTELVLNEIIPKNFNNEFKKRNDLLLNILQYRREKSGEYLYS